MDNYSNDTMLKLNNVTKIYPGTIALHAVNIEVKKGEVHGIIGKNGAGKSTLVSIVAGLIPPTGGEIILDGKRYESLTRIKSKQEKIAIVTQEPQVISDFTVAENLFIPDYTCKARMINWAALFKMAEEVIMQAGLDIDPRAKAGDLTISEQQLLLVLKACYIENARIIILDEASASLSQADEKILYRIIQERKNGGATIIFISHRIGELMEVCDRVTVIRDGYSITTRNICDLDKEKMASLIVGQNSQYQQFELDRRQEEKAFGETILSVSNLTSAGRYRNISFELKKGEILGLAGLRGSGRTEILKSVGGIDSFDNGSITKQGKQKKYTAPSQALKDGIVYLPEDRENEAIFANASVRANIALSSLSQLRKGLFIDSGREKGLVNDIVERLKIKIASLEQEAQQLSGGNKQKVVVGRISAIRPDVFLLDEPTRGVDIDTREGILRAIKEDLSQYSGIVMTSPGLEDLIKICDRILVLNQGEITGEYRVGDFDEERLYTAVQGVNHLDRQNSCAMEIEENN